MAASTIVPTGGGQRYYTFAPGKAPAGRKGDEIKLQPGQTLHFAAGKGYYAGPAAPPLHPNGNPYARTYPVSPNTPYVPISQMSGKGASWSGLRGGGGGAKGGGGGAAKPPAPPWWAALTPAQIQAKATALANAALLPQQQEIRRQQALAARNAQEQEAQMQGFAQAAAGIESGFAPQVSQAYSTATQDVGALGQGLSTGIQQDVASQQAADQAEAAKQGIATSDQINTPALHDTMFGITGLVPGQSMAARGAAEATLAAGAPQIQLNAGRQDLEQAMAKAKETNDGYAQQLIQLAAQFPGQKAQALDALNKYELDKADYRLRVRAELASETAALGKNQLTPYQKGSLAAENKRLAMEQQRINNQFKYEMAGLRFKNAQAANKATLLGKTIDVPASKALGYVRYKDGTVDKSIKVAKDVAAGSTAAGRTRIAAVKQMNKDVAAAGTKAYETAFKALGDPVKIKQPGPSQHGRRTQGIYQAARWARGKPGVYADGSTNKTQYAARTGRAAGWNAVFNNVWGEINGDHLMAAYGLSRQQVASMVVKQMIRAGWNRKFSGG